MYLHCSPVWAHLLHPSQTPGPNSNPHVLLHEVVPAGLVVTARGTRAVHATETASSLRVSLSSYSLHILRLNSQSPRITNRAGDEGDTELVNTHCLMARKEATSCIQRFQKEDRWKPPHLSTLPRHHSVGTTSSQSENFPYSSKAKIGKGQEQSAKGLIQSKDDMSTTKKQLHVAKNLIT